MGGDPEPRCCNCDCEYADVGADACVDGSPPACTPAWLALMNVLEWIAETVGLTPLVTSPGLVLLVVVVQVWLPQVALQVAQMA